MTLAEHVLQGQGCPEQGGICTAAFSGGADSTALLLVLHELADVRSLDLRAVHVHHGIRGEEADRDAAFCASLCERLHIPFQAVYVDAPAYAAAQHVSLETAARILRYDALETAAPEGEIATAHHAGDHAETVLHHLMRGCGLNGLTGIPPKAGRRIRPLLTAQKDEILAFLAERHQPYCEDSTNADDDSTRNRIRHRILPLMEAENPAFLRRIAEMTQTLSDDAALLSQLALDAYAARRREDGGVHSLETVQKPLRMRIYMHMLSLLPVRVDPAFAKLCEIDRLVLQKNGRAALSADVYAQVWRGILYIDREMPQSDVQIPLMIGENPLPDGKTVSAALLSRNSHKSDTKSTLDFDRIKGTPYLRTARGADTIRLPGRDFASSLRKMLQTAYPVPRRRCVPALFDDAGCIWCAGIGIDRRVKPDAQTERLLTLTVRYG